MISEHVSLVVAALRVDGATRELACRSCTQKSCQDRTFAYKNDWVRVVHGAGNW